MPTIEQVQDMIKELEGLNTFGTKKEIKFLPEVLKESEKILYLTSVFLVGTLGSLYVAMKELYF